MNNGQGAFSLSAVCLLDSVPWFPRGDVAINDLNGDGLPDLVATSGPAASAGSVFIFHNIGLGQFGPPQHIVVAQHADSVQIADCNGDSYPDIVVTHDHNFPTTLQNQDAYLTVLFNSPMNPFSQRIERSNPSVLTIGSSALVVGPAGSGPQLVIPAAAGVLMMPLQLANTQHQATASYSGPDSVTNVALVDIDMDGRCDLVAPVVSISTTAILKNRKCPTPCYPNCDGSPSAPNLNVADFICFLNAFASGDAYANCDRSTSPPYLNVQDFNCFLAAFVSGCP
jgi:hypothetical protein